MLRRTATLGATLKVGRFLNASVAHRARQARDGVQGVVLVQVLGEVQAPRAEQAHGRLVQLAVPSVAGGQVDARLAAAPELVAV